MTGWALRPCGRAIERALKTLGGSDSFRGVPSMRSRGSFRGEAERRTGGRRRNRLLQGVGAREAPGAGTLRRPGGDDPGGYGVRHASELPDPFGGAGGHRPVQPDPGVGDRPYPSCGRRRPAGGGAGHRQRGGQARRGHCRRRPHHRGAGHPGAPAGGPLHERAHAGPPHGAGEPGEAQERRLPRHGVPRPATWRAATKARAVSRSLRPSSRRSAGLLRPGGPDGRAGGGHRGPQPGAAGPGPLPLQPVLGEDGLRPGAGGRPARRPGGAGERPHRAGASRGGPDGAGGDRRRDAPGGAGGVRRGHRGLHGPRRWRTTARVPRRSTR